MTGYVLSLRKGGFPWKRPMRVAAALAIPAALFTISQWKLFFTRYDTSIEWNTFMVVIGVGMVAHDDGLRLQDSTANLFGHSQHGWPQSLHDLALYQKCGIGWLGPFIDGLLDLAVFVFYDRLARPEDAALMYRKAREVARH